VSTGVVKWSGGLRNRVSIIVIYIYISGCFVYHILSYSFGSVFIVSMVVCFVCYCLIL
jgi:hypothetical protein